MRRYVVGDGEKPARYTHTRDSQCLRESEELDKLFHGTLKRHLLRYMPALPKMAKAAQNAELAAAFEKHHGETEGQIERLEEVFEAIDATPQDKRCPLSKESLRKGRRL